MLTELTVGDTPAPWAALGFAVDPAAATTRVGAVTVGLTGDGGGITGWALGGLAAGIDDLDGLAVAHSDGPGPGPPPSTTTTPADGVVHPNGVRSIDHVVLATPNLPRTVDALVGAGLELRRVRDAGHDDAGGRRQQAFFWLGEVILEVVGPAQAAGVGPPRLWGLAFTADLGQAADWLGDRLRPPKPAVQPGRLIATVDRSAGSAVPMVLLSPHPASRVHPA